MRPPVPEIHAHRAGPVVDGTAVHAEQTLPAFAAAWATPGLVCELDVRQTSDGVPVVFHDETLDRVTGVRGRLDEVDAIAFSKLRATVLGADRRLARAYAPVPLATLRDVLALARSRGGRLNVELKALPGDADLAAGSAFAARVADEIRRSGLSAESLRVQSFRPEILLAFAGRLPGAARALLVEGPEDAVCGALRAVASRCPIVGFRWPVDREGIDFAHELGLEVMAFTINDEHDVRAAARAGVDVIITDDPAMARRALSDLILTAA